MFRKHTVAIVTSAAACALLLTACGGGDDKDSSAPAAATSAAGAGQSAGQDLNLLSGTAKKNNAPAGTGDWANEPGKPAVKPEATRWVQLSAAKAGALDPVVVNGAGFTLYRFDKDTANPSKSTCNGECAVTWPPVVVAPGGKIFLDGVDKSKVGVVKRDDGTRQVTVGGWPVYRFAKDTRPGDTKGQGVGGTWFGVTPDGKKAGTGSGDTGTGSRPGPAASVVLFDERNFGDPSQGLAGKGCQNVARDDVASSLQARGSLKIWSGRDCTGKSKVVDGDVADLAAIGFDNTVSSVFFG
ncbi:lipoprotein [Streptomyces eurocidicus]|uniref:Lipoprotein n=1 Tax=Streptomyces eurocidicus TaxID=66423 RepID=A0A2N8NTQ2_STREU|nr:hypothetical protein [Streptomyces eurocidicus]MBB5119407.1 putative lipoprotein with Yx(FWY)xxD motif [Streptomyces eurocidicus]MBF6053014.1 hypothetical protein [Streptomyces eurocidicus]PNE32146.1 lipoprotein [Streptomyces eurocidicus]